LMVRAACTLANGTLSAWRAAANAPGLRLPPGAAGPHRAGRGWDSADIGAADHGQTNPQGGVSRTLSDVRGRQQPSRFLMDYGSIWRTTKLVRADIRGLASSV